MSDAILVDDPGSPGWSPPGVGPSTPPTGGVAQVATIAAGIVVAAVAVWALVTTGVPVPDVLRYTAAWTLGLVVPGTIVHRLLRGRPDRLLTDLALGAATGMALEVALGVAAMAIGQDHLAPWWPLLVYATLVHPRVRAVTRPRRYPLRETPAQAWVTAATAVVVLCGPVTRLRATPLPPTAGAVNIDRWWHLGIVQELLRPGAPMEPRVAGEPLVYHWFSHLHMAVTGTIADVDPATVLLRLWLVPVALLAIGMVVALARHASGTSWTGPLAATTSFVLVSSGLLWPSPLIATGDPVSFSPSQMVSVVALATAGVGFVTACRRHLRPGELAWLVLATGWCIGAKPTATPILLCATVLATLVAAVVSRPSTGRLAGLAALLAGQLLFLMPLVARRATSGTGKITLLGSLDSLWPYDRVVGEGRPLATSPGLLLDTLVDGRSWLVAGITLGVFLAARLVRVAGLSLLVVRETRGDVAAWWLSGAWGAGFGVFLLLDHASGGQFSVLGSMTVFSSVLGAWLLAVLLARGESRERTAGAVALRVLGVVLGGAAVGILGRLLAGGVSRPVLDDVAVAWIPLVVTAGGIAVVVLVVGVQRVHEDAPPVHRGALVLLAVLGMALPGAVIGAASIVRTAALVQPPPPATSNVDHLTAEEQEAALWIRDNTDPEALLATNVHCRPQVSFRVPCDARGYWLSGLSGRRILLEGWGYMPQTHALHGRDGRHFANQPSPWPDLLEDSMAAVHDPSPATIDALRDRGVDLVVADRLASDDVDVDGLAEVATEVYDNGVVAVFRIDPAT